MQVRGDVKRRRHVGTARHPAVALMVCRGARREKVTRCYVERLSHLAFAAPTIVEAICQGRQPAELSTETLLNRVELPLGWSEQVNAIGID